MLNNAEKLPRRSFLTMNEIQIRNHMINHKTFHQVEYIGIIAMLELGNAILLDSTMKFPLGWIVTAMYGVVVELSLDKLYKYALQRLGRGADDMNFYQMGRIK